MQYIELLSQIGINDPELVELFNPPPIKTPPPLALLGEYEFWDWGDHVLRDLNEPGCEHPFALDWSDEQHTAWKKIHRYSRRDRFKFTVYQLLACGGDVPPDVVAHVRTTLGRFTSKSKIWNQVREILKSMKLRRYYNRIPLIIRQLSSTLTPCLNGVKIGSLLDRFEVMDYKFNNELRAKWSRSYFPNMRFIALQMFEEAGITYPYKIPKVRTLRKKRYLLELFKDFKE